MQLMGNSKSPSVKRKNHFKKVCAPLISCQHAPGITPYMEKHAQNATNGKDWLKQCAGSVR
ncbi:hypothetical protein BRL53_05155 [Corynebacterium ulcerans]|nr:hypothetical protein BRL53_05155 [Corynebacterium ulcerans]